MSITIEIALENNIVKSIKRLGWFELLMVIISIGLIIFKLPVFWFIVHLTLGILQLIGTKEYLAQLNYFKFWVRYYKIYKLLILISMIVPLFGLFFLFFSSYIAAFILAFLKIRFNENKLINNQLYGNSNTNQS